MKSFSQSAFLIGSFVLVLALPPNANGCSCQDYHVPVCAAYWNADAVFVGYVKTITEADKKSGDEFLARLRVVVEQPLRGITESEVDVLTAWKTSCDIGFKVGERWLIYAHHNEEMNTLVAGACSLTKRFEDADADLAYAHSVIEARARQSIMGSIVEEMWTPLSGVKVLLDGAEVKFDTVTDENGLFEFRDLRPGKYSIRAYVPFSADVAVASKPAFEVKATEEQSEFKYELDLPGGRCHYRQLDLFRVNLHATAEVSGTLITKSGEPLTSGYLYLVSADKGSDRLYGEIDKSGTFRIGGVAAGRYFLVMNPNDDPPDGSNAPYARTYFPGVSNSRDASLITVTEGAKLENLNIRLPALLKQRVITGKVVWSNGRPVPDAMVFLYNTATNREVTGVRSDQLGHFELKVYGDFKYEIDADSDSVESGKSERVKVPQSGALKPFKLVLKPE